MNAIATSARARPPRFALRRGARTGARADAADRPAPPVAAGEPTRVQQRRAQAALAPGLRRVLGAAVVAAHAVAGYALQQSSSLRDVERVQPREVVVPVYMRWIEPAPPPSREQERPVDAPLARRPIASPPPAAALTEAVAPSGAATPVRPVAPQRIDAPVAVPAPPAEAAAGGESTSAPTSPAPVALPAPLSEPRTVDVREVGYLTPPRPGYPPLSRRLGEEGRVTLRVWVDADGRPGQILVITSSGYTRLDEAAVEAARDARFRPYLAGGVAQPVWVLVPFVFRLEAGS